MWHRSPQPQKCVGKDAPVTEYAIRRIAIEASTKPQVLDPPFKEPFNSAVEKAMLLLGESGKQATYYHLEKTFYRKFTAERIIRNQDLPCPIYTRTLQNPSLKTAYEITEKGINILCSLERDGQNPYTMHANDVPEGLILPAIPGDI